LFDHVGLPLAPSEALPSLAQRKEEIGERIAFFWMMMSVTAKYAIRESN
jgi:hypothetical protein